LYRALNKICLTINNLCRRPNKMRRLQKADT
jgi:hypothetical protein